MTTPNNGRKRLSDILLNSERARLERLWKTTAPAADLSPIPPDDYECSVSNGELFESRGGTPGYKLTLAVRDGEYAGRRLWLDFWLSEAALPYSMRDLAKLGVEHLEQLERPLPAGIIVRARVALRRGDDGAEFNRVTRFEVVAIEPPEADPFAPSEEEGESGDEPEPDAEGTTSEVPF